jgi:hydrogenase-4 component F
LLRLHGFAFGAPSDGNAPVRGSYLPAFAHLALVLVAGVYLPPLLVDWFQHVARMLG